MALWRRKRARGRGHHSQRDAGNGGIEIRGQDGVSLEEIPLLDRDPAAREMLRTLIENGLTLEEVEQELKRVPTNRYEQKVAARSALDDQIRTLRAGF